MPTIPSYQFCNSTVAGLCMLNGSFTPDSNGSVSSFTGEGIQGIHARPAHTPAGVYYVELDRNYQQLVGFSWFGVQGTTGSPVASGSLVTGTAYEITTVGTTNWGTAGFYSEDFTAQVGSSFVALATSAGTGTATALTSVGVANIDILPYSKMMKNSTPGEGSLFILKCYDYANSAAFPANGCTIQFQLWLNSSTVRF